MTHSRESQLVYMWHDTFTCMPWLILTCAPPALWVSRGGVRGISQPTPPPPPPPLRLGNSWWRPLCRGWGAHEWDVLDMEATRQHLKTRACAACGNIRAAARSLCMCYTHENTASAAGFHVCAYMWTSAHAHTCHIHERHIHKCCSALPAILCVSVI